MSTNLARAGLIARQVELDSVSLRGAQVVSHVDPLSPPDELRLSQAYRARFELPKAHADSLYVYVDLHFEVGDASGEPDGPIQVLLDATYLLVYRLKGNEERPDDALQHFAELNGTYNVWPYWRELVQTVAGRIGLASIVVPVFRPQARVLGGGQEGTAESSTPGDS